MFRASHIASEETLPALSVDVIKKSNINDGTPGVSSKLNENAGKPVTYGLTTIIYPVHYKYPVAVFFILIAKFFEAFAANGIRTILALYLRDDLYFSQNFSTIMLHVFNFFGQFCPIFGAVLADSYLGNVRTISTFCYLYFLGWLLLIVTSLPYMGISLIFLVTLSLLFIAIGNGSIRACITSLGAIQFKLPEQTLQLAEYFSFYYFFYYFGIFLSKLLPPIVRVNTHCFNKTDCYPAVFGTLTTSFLLSWVTFSIGRLFYKPEKINEENILIKFFGCIKHALLVKWRKVEKRTEPKYWLHNAIGRYDETFVNDVAQVLRISKLFIPLPIYFALLAQQDSSWTFQASMMNTTIAGVTIQPDQAKAIGPVFLFILIPLWSYVGRPMLKHCFKCELKPLQSVTLGGVFSAFSFVCAGLLQNHIAGQPYKSINIIWQMPQFLLIMLGELFLSIPGLQFAFTQAPTSMKSVVTAAWFLNNAFGNLLVVIITELNFIQLQSSEYFFYAVLMLFAVYVYTLLAYDFVLHETLGTYSSHSNLTAPSEAIVVLPEENTEVSTPSTSNKRTDINV